MEPHDDHRQGAEDRQWSSTARRSRSIDLNEWPEPGKRPDGSKHKFAKVAIKDLNRPGYLGFQDHGKDCWFKNVKLKDLD